MLYLLESPKSCPRTGQQAEFLIKMMTKRCRDHGKDTLLLRHDLATKKTKQEGLTKQTLFQFPLPTPPKKAVSFETLNSHFNHRIQNVTPKQSCALSHF